MCVLALNHASSISEVTEDVMLNASLPQFKNIHWYSKRQMSMWLRKPHSIRWSHLSTQINK